jgi:hypothetical protein
VGGVGDLGEAGVTGEAGGDDVVPEDDLHDDEEEGLDLNGPDVKPEPIDDGDGAAGEEDEEGGVTPAIARWRGRGTRSSGETDSGRAGE